MIGSSTFGSVAFGSGSYYSSSTQIVEMSSPGTLFFLGGVDVTSKVIRNSTSLSENMQQRATECTFKMWDLFPSEYEEIRVFTGYYIGQSSTNSVILNTKENFKTLYRVGDLVYIGAGTASEETKIISSITYTNGYITLTFTTNFVVNPSINTTATKLMFAGNVMNPSDYNIGTIQNQECTVKAIDYTKIFDKKAINDTYAVVDARYIINDFCNRTINYNQVVDEYDYVNNAALRATYVESGDGSNPLLNVSDYREGSQCGQYPWVFSSGTASWVGTLPSIDASIWSGIASGVSTKGVLGFWYKISTLAPFTVRIGSSSSNYASFTITPTETGWVFFDSRLSTASYTGTVNWTAITYVSVIVTETASGNILIDGIRFLEHEFFRHYPYVLSTDNVATYNIAKVKPVQVMQTLADTFQWFWYVDYERYLHFFPTNTNNSPYSITTTSNNFMDLSFDYDTSRLVNMQVVEGGNETSSSFYYEIKECDGVTKEWITKNKFKNLVTLIDDNTVTDLMEAGTTTTQVKATAHGLSSGQWVVNRTRGIARQIISIDSVDLFTLNAAITGQTNGDTFSKFYEVAYGVEGLAEDALNYFMMNYQQKSIRNGTSQSPFPIGTYVQFKYNEVTPIIVSRKNLSSIANMKSILGYTDGVFEGQLVSEPRISSRVEASDFADSILGKYSNMIITAKFKGDVHGLDVGQTIRITDTTNNRNIDQDFVILQLQKSLTETGYWKTQVTCSTLLFGMLELLQQLLRNGRKSEINAESQVNNSADADEIVTISDSVTSNINGNVHTETCTISDSITTRIFAGPFTWQPDTEDALWDLSQWG